MGNEEFNEQEGKIYGDEELDYGDRSFGPARTMSPEMANWYLKRVKSDGMPEHMIPERRRALEMRAIETP